MKKFSIPASVSSTNEVRSVVMQPATRSMQRKVAQKHTVGTNSNNVALALEMQEDILCLVITEVDGKKVSLNSVQLNKEFNAKEIALLQAAFDKMNGMDEEIIESFLASAEEVETENTQQVLSSIPRKLS